MRQSVETLAEQSMLRVPGFHTAFNPPLEEGADPEAPPPKAILRPIEGPDAERLALQMIAQATAARHESSAVLAPFLGPGGGVRDAMAAQGVIHLADALRTETAPAFAAQLQLLDALLATKAPSALGMLKSSAHLAVTLHSIISRSQKQKAYTLITKSLRAMALLDGCSFHLTWKARQFLRNLAKDEQNLSVAYAARDLIATWPPDDDVVATPSAPPPAAAAVPVAQTSVASEPQPQQPQTVRPPPQPPVPSKAPTLPPRPIDPIAVALAAMKPDIPFAPPPINETAMEFHDSNRRLPGSARGVAVVGGIPRADPTWKPISMPFIPTDPKEYEEQNKEMLRSGVGSLAYVNPEIKE